jgi:TolB-like protein/class 3 adenylate cyclase
MAEGRKLAAILAADVVGFSRLAGSDEDRTLARLRTLRSDLIDPTISVHRGRVVKRTGDGAIVEFRSAVDAVRCAIEVQNGMVERNAGLPPERRIEFRIGIHIGDVVEESDGDLMGDGVNIAARLEPVAKPGGICLSEDAYRQVKARLDLAVTDLGQRELKNIAEPIKVFAIEPITETLAKWVPHAGPATTSQRAQPDKPSIAVLPFQNMSGDPEQDYFADGIVDDIITGLSRIKWLFVIARNWSFVYKGKAIDVRQVGRELGVRYLLEGGVRKSGGRIRITAQLVEAETGAHLWADKFDGALKDIFDLQDRITDRVVAIVEPSVQKSEMERARRKRPDSLDAYDLFLRAVPFTRSQSAAEGRIAIGFLEEALKIDPGYAAAHALLAWCYEWCYSRGGFDEADKAAALSHASAALTGGTDDATALAVAGFVTTMLSKDHGAGLNAIDRALSLNPSCATALYLAAITNAFSGHPARATEYAKRALRLSPFDLLLYLAYLAQGLASTQEERYEDAAAYLDQSLQANPTLSSLRFIAASAHALSGRLETARAIAGKGLEMEPGFTLRLFFELMTWEVADKLAKGGRMLGLPD